MRRAIALGVVVGALLATVPAALGAAASTPAMKRPVSVAPVVSLPSPPTLPPSTTPSAVEPFLAVAGPTAGALCGTLSLGVLLAPSLAQGYFHIPVDTLIDRHSLNSYASTALYVCGFIPSPLTQSQCQVDGKIVDALRGFNPLIAQVVGLYPEGATVDTILAVEALLPTGPTVAGPVVTDLSRLMQCTRSNGVPPVPAAKASPQPASKASAPPGSAPPPPIVSTLRLPAGGSTPSAKAAYGVGEAAPIATPASVAAPVIYETRLTARKPLQVLGIALGLLLLFASLVGWLASRKSILVNKMTVRS